MYIFRWLMKHPIIILALYFASIAAILYSMMGGGSTDKNIDTAEVVKTDSANVDLSNAPAIEPSTLTSALVGGEASTVEKDATQTDASQTTETENKDEIPSTEASTAVVPESEDKQVTSAPEVVTAAAVDTETQFSEMSADELLLMAREAYWNNGLEESAQIYQQLISASPDVIDYKGELGNVYWRQGFPKKAAELYAEISIPMIEAGDTNKVANMVGFIGLFYPEKATDIHNRLQVKK